MCLLLYYANYIKLLDKVADDVSEMRYNLKKQTKNWQNDSSLFILETDETGHKSEKFRKSKWVLNFSWKFWKMWKIGKKESDKHGSSQVRILLLPKKSEISIVPVVPVKTDSLHIIIPAKKPHFDWKFWKKKCTNEKSLRYFTDTSVVNRPSKSDTQLAEKLRRKEMLKEKSTLSKRRGRDTIVSHYFHKTNKCRSQSRRGSFIDYFAVNGKLIEKSWKRISFEDNLLPPCTLLKQNGPQHMIVASAVDTSKDNKWEDESYTDSDYSDESHYSDSSSRFFVGRNIISPDEGVQDKKKEWMTRDDTLIKEADITDPDIKKRDIIPRGKRRSRFGSFDMKTTIVSETPTPQSPYAKKRISKLFIRKVPPKSIPPPPPAKREPIPPPKREPTPPQKRAVTPPPKRAETPPPKPQQAQSEPSYSSKPQLKPKPKPRSEPQQQPPPKQESPPEPEPVCAETQPVSVKRERTKLSLAKLRIPLRLANRKLQIRIPKQLLLDSIHGEQDGKQGREAQGQNKRIQSRRGRIGVRGLNAHSRKVLLDSRRLLQAVGLDVLDDPQPGCVFKRAFGCFSSDSNLSETRDDEESIQNPSVSVKGGKAEKKAKKRKLGMSRIRIIAKSKKPRGTTVYKCLRSVRERGICCCGKRRKVNKKVYTPQLIIEDSTISVPGKRGCCRCWCCLFLRKKCCDCRNLNYGDRLDSQKKRAPNPCDCKMAKICRFYSRDLQNRLLSERRAYGPRIIIKRRGRHYHSLLDEDSSDETSNLSGSDDPGDSREMRPARERRYPQANYSMSAIQLHNEYTEASHSRLKPNNSILDSYFLLG